MVIQVQKEIKPKKYEFSDAYKKALEDGDIIITSLKSKDKYRIENVEGKTKLKFFSSTIDNWRNCPFILAEEISNKWILEKNGVVEYES